MLFRKFLELDKNETTWFCLGSNLHGSPSDQKCKKWPRFQRESYIMGQEQWKNSPNNQIRLSAWLYVSTCNCMNRAFLLYKTWLICFVHLVACSQDKFPEKFHFSIISSPWSRGRVWEQYAGGPWFKSTLNDNFFFVFFQLFFFTRWPFPLLKTILNTKKKYFSLYLLRKKR